MAQNPYDPTPEGAAKPNEGQTFADTLSAQPSAAAVGKTATINNDGVGLPNQIGGDAPGGLAPGALGAPDTNPFAGVGASPGGAQTSAGGGRPPVTGTPGYVPPAAAGAGYNPNTWHLSPSGALDIQDQTKPLPAGYYWGGKYDFAPAMDPAANPFNTADQRNQRRMDYVASREAMRENALSAPAPGSAISGEWRPAQADSDAAGVREAAQGINQGAYGLRPLPDGSGNVVGGQSNTSMGNSWTDTWLPRITMAVMGYGIGQGVGQMLGGAGGGAGAAGGQAGGQAAGQAVGEGVGQAAGQGLTQAELASLASSGQFTAAELAAMAGGPVYTAGATAAAGAGLGSGALGVGAGLGGDALGAYYSAGNDAWLAPDGAGESAGYPGAGQNTPYNGELGAGTAQPWWKSVLGAITGTGGSAGTAGTISKYLTLLTGLGNFYAQYKARKDQNALLAARQQQIQQLLSTDPAAAYNQMYASTTLPTTQLSNTQFQNATAGQMMKNDVARTLGRGGFGANSGVAEAANQSIGISTLEAQNKAVADYENQRRQLVLSLLGAAQQQRAQQAGILAGYPLPQSSWANLGDALGVLSNYYSQQNNPQKVAATQNPVTVYVNPTGTTASTQQAANTVPDWYMAMMNGAGGAAPSGATGA